MSTNHRSLQDSAQVLPSTSGDRDFDIEFSAPGLSTTTSLHARPYLSYRVNPGSDAGVHVIMELNGTEVVDQTIDTTVSRQFDEIFDHGVLRATGNTLRVFVPNDERGTVTVSDLILVYTES